MCSGAPPPRRDGYARARREIQEAGQNVTLVAHRSVAEVNATVDNLTTLMCIAVPALVLLVAFAVWYFADARSAGRADPAPGGVDHRLHHPPARARARHRRRGRAPRAHDERDARSTRAVVATPAAVRERRVPRAAQPARVDPRQPRSGAAQLRPRRLAGRRAPRARGGPAHGRHRERAARARPTRRSARRRALDLASGDRPRRARARRDLAAPHREQSTRPASRPDACTGAATSWPVWCATSSTTRAATRRPRSRSRCRPPTPPSSSPSTTTVPASTPTTASGCSSASPVSTTVARATPAASASASRS